MRAGNMKKIIALAAVAVMFGACEDSFYKVNSLSDFKVTTGKSVYKVGERVDFQLTSDADFIAFYSGEVGYDYEYKSKDRLYPDKMLLSFSTATYPDNGTNPRSGRFMWSNDFPGVYEPEWIRMSTWHDITDRIVYPQPSPTSYILYDTENIDIEDLFDKEDPTAPIYFCWWFETSPETEDGSIAVRNRFRIDNWRIHGETNREMEFYSFAQTAFSMIEGVGFDVEPHATYFPRVTDKYIVWDGISKPTVYKDGWAISGPIYHSENINAGKDASVIIKTIGDPVKKSHNHYYSKPGTYEVVFEAINENSKNRASAIARTTVTIEGEESVEIVADPIEVSADEIVVAASGTASFNLRCRSNWTITTSDSSLSVDPQRGNAGDMYHVRVKLDAGADFGTLTIKAGTSEKTVSVRRE